MSASDVRSLTLPAETASLKQARDFVAHAVAGYVDDPTEVLLMTSELVSNVVGHVGSAVTITVRDGTVRDGTVRDGTVSDGTVRDGTVRDGTVRDGTVRDGTVRDGTVRDGTVRDGTVRDGPLVRIEVHNHQAATEAFRDLLHNSERPSNTSPTGRGLGLVRSLACRVGLDDDDANEGKVVWFEWEHPARKGQGDAAIEADGEPVPVP